MGARRRGPTCTPDQRRPGRAPVGARDVERQGWDALTGFGVLDVGAALALPAEQLPIHDPLEPNDNLVWVDGRVRQAARSGRRANASTPLDKEEDPVDVYRIVPAGRRVRDPALRRPVEVFAPRDRSTTTA